MSSIPFRRSTGCLGTPWRSSPRKSRAKENTMSSTPVSTEQQPATGVPAAATVDLKLEVVVIPVSDVDRAKRFYGSLGWRLDADFAAGDDFRVIQFTLSGSPCSVIF